MAVLNQNPPPRPACCQFVCMAGLYAAFEEMRALEGGVIHSGCGHDVLIFNHHFFHMAGVSRLGSGQLSMPGELNEILATVSGFGRYELAHGGSRARNLPSALLTIKEPDEVWMDNPVATTAKWVYLKQFEGKPYPYTVALVGERPLENGIIVPFSGFQCNARVLRKWRQGVCIYEDSNSHPKMAVG